MAATGGSAIPKPGPPKVKRWYQTRQSPYLWEQTALDHIRRLMPATAPHYAWATFSFTAASGRINECDLFVAVPRGLYLVELKGHPGRVINNGDTWSFHAPDGRIRTIRNPLHLTDLKSKELRYRLQWALNDLRPEGRELRVPRIEPVVFLSDSQLRSELDMVQRTRVYGRDGYETGLPAIWGDLLSQPPERENWRVREDFTRYLPKLMQKIGVRASTAHLDFGDWRLDPRPLDAGPTWEDRIAERQDPVRQEGRVRIYLVEQQATDERRRSTTRAAEREFKVLQGINHRGIAQAVDFRQHQGGPAILFRHRVSDLRLDQYLAVHGEKLTETVRRDLVRQLAEAVRYAHRRSLYHRALAARSVYVSAKDNGAHPTLRIIDWQASARHFDTTTSHASVGNSSLTQQHVEDAALCYLAPETDADHPEPGQLDVFGLGAVAYHILTGTPPALTRTALKERLTAEGGLHMYAVDDAVDPGLEELVYAATRRSVDDRLESAEAFLDQLDEAEQATAAQAVAVEADPLTATPGQTVDGDWSVERVLGSGATARALYVTRVTEDDHGRVTEDRRVLKVALDADKNERLESEARALEQVSSSRIVKLYGNGPRTIGGRRVLTLEYAGAETLGERLRSEGRLLYSKLESFSNDLFMALDDLAAKGMLHRDLKPDNLGITLREDGEEQLMLFDFSLAGVPDRDIKAGTRGYLDPFLGSARRPIYDEHAERYATAVVLHEMASGERPVWGDGSRDPLTGMTDETPVLATEAFQQRLGPGLEDFFKQALHRDTDQRFESLRQMRDAWRRIFIEADRTPAPPAKGVAGLTGTEGLSQDEIRDLHAAKAGLDTSLTQAGLTERAADAAGELGADTVEQLLDLPLTRFRQRGIGPAVRKELTRRHRQWTDTLRPKKSRKRDPEAPSPKSVAMGAADDQLGAEPDARQSVNRLAALLNPVPPGRRDNKRPQVVAAWLGLDGTSTPGSWPTNREVATALGISEFTVSKHLTTAAEHWAGQSWLTQLREELADILQAAGRIMTAQELARELLVRHGGEADTANEALIAALAVVRAALTAENVLKDQQDENYEPRFTQVRRRGRLLVAMTSTDGSDEPTDDELSAYAMELGDKADTLAAADPLPDPAAVLRLLRAVSPPEGTDPLPDTRLVTLAAATSSNAAASPRLELYPRSLSMARALKTSQAAAGVRREVGISTDGLLARLRSRFPEMELGRPTYVEVEDALAEAGFPLKYDTTDSRFRPPAPAGAALSGGPSSSVSTTSSVLASMTVQEARAAAGRDPSALLAAKLGTAVQEGGFLALNVAVKRLPGAANAVAEHFPVHQVNLAELFIEEFRALASEHGTDWPKVLAADTRYTRSGQLPNGLRSFVARVWPRVRTRLDRITTQDPEAVLFVHTAGLLSHYYEAGGHQLLVDLQREARRPGRQPHGLWLLVPSHNPRGIPELDGHTVEVTGGDAERVVLSGDFLRELAAVPAAAGER
ncbi:BREX system serine/threonine kinase PglW [Streptomyces sp. B21-108]|uniref:BREX system serine/threonine kinase PglW n=1 Tax=Streptomyces sp. B21-108 TaxID=3039419 RepID=UPI002FEF9135